MLFVFMRLRFLEYYIRWEFEKKRELILIYFYYNFINIKILILKFFYFGFFNKILGEKNSFEICRRL